MVKKFQLYVAVLDWHDGDTFHGVVDQGFWTYRGSYGRPVRVRCALIQAPELLIDGQRNPAGADALQAAARIAPPGEYPCWSYKPDPDSFGRPLLDLVLPDGGLFSAAMLAGGYAVPYKAAG